MKDFINDPIEELRIRRDALRGLLFAECGFELNDIAAVEAAAVSEALGPSIDEQELPQETVGAAAD